MAEEASRIGRYCTAMAGTRAVRVTRPARLGLAALVFLLLAGGGIYVAVKYVRGGGGYQFGVHFPTAAGVAPGAQVYLSGVNIGAVSRVTILPDTSVDFIINVFSDTDIPLDAKFSVQTALTGSPVVAISVPQRHIALNEVPTPMPSSELWPKRILPVSEQPIGAPPITLEAFMRQSRALGDRAYAMLAQARPYGKPLAHHLESARENGAATAARLRSTAPVLLATVQSTMTRAKANVQAARSALRAPRNQAEITALATSLESTIADMQRTASVLGQLKRDPSMRQNARGATAELRTITANLAGLTRDLQMIAGSAQTKAELRDAGDRLRGILKNL